MYLDTSVYKPGYIPHPFPLLTMPIEKVHFLSVPEMVSPSFKFSLVLLMQTDQCTTGGNFACSKDILDIQILYVFEDWILNDKG